MGSNEPNYTKETPMLSNDVIAKINRQIEDELRTVGKTFADHDEKMEALERIAKLKEILSPNPSAEQIAQHVANFLNTAATQPNAEPDSMRILRNLASIFPK
jgi:hypothetical protein